MGQLNLVLHVLHIVAGVVWAGGTILMGLFVAPAALATRPESGRFLQYLTGPRKLPLFMTTAAWIAVLSGLAMFAPTLGNLGPGVMRSPRGLTLSLGAFIALGAFLEGMFVNAPAAARIGRLGQAIAASGQGPTAEQLQQLQALQARVTRGSARGAVMLLVAVVCMAAARWL